MRDIHFRVSDSMYARIQEEAEDQGTSVANFGREATIARAAVWAYRRGMQWGDDETWEPFASLMERMDRHDAKLRADKARQRRQRRG